MSIRQHGLLATAALVDVPAADRRRALGTRRRPVPGRRRRADTETVPERRTYDQRQRRSGV